PMNMLPKMSRVLTLTGLVAALATGTLPQQAGTATAQTASGTINHLVVIYQEYHSFDNYFGTFPGADGIATAGRTATQVDRQGQPYATLPAPLADPVEGRRSPG